jgi:hypothetical protein
MVITVVTLGLGGVSFSLMHAVDPKIGDLGRASVLGRTLSIQAHDRKGPFELKVRQGRVLAASIGPAALPAERIRQAGERVILVGADQQPALFLTVRPEGRVEWTGRS